MIINSTEIQSLASFIINQSNQIKKRAEWSY